LLLSAVLRAPAQHGGRLLSIDIISCTRGAQQQTRCRLLLLSIDVTDGRTDRQTVSQTVVPISPGQGPVPVLLAVLDPRVGHTMDVLSPFIPVLCPSD